MSVCVFAITARVSCSIPLKLAVVAEGAGGQVIAGLTSPVLLSAERYPSISAFSFVDEGHFLIIVSLDFRFLPDLIRCRLTFEFKLIITIFADDMVVMAESVEGLQHNLQVMSDVLSRWELRVNWRKTKVMRIARKREECEVKIDEEVIEQVDAMKYLGVMISSDGRMEKEVEARIGGATQVIGGLNDVVLRRKELSRSTKLKVVNATVMPTLLYGCEMWTLSKQQQLKMQATQMKVLRRIEGVTRLDRMRNVDIREKLRQESVLDAVKRRQEKWRFRLEEMSNERLTKKVFVGEMEGKRPRGRPRSRWTDNFK